MLVLLSPAKIEPTPPGGAPSLGQVFLPETGPILHALRAYSPWQLESLMKVNPEIALKTFDFTKSSTRPAWFPGSPQLPRPCIPKSGRRQLYWGGLRLRPTEPAVLSAFWGAPPLDGMLPYRLDFLCPVKVEGSAFTPYWGIGFTRRYSPLASRWPTFAPGEYSRAFDPYRTGRGTLCPLPVLAVAQREVGYPAHRS